jgi:hypothetical protein
LLSHFWFEADTDWVAMLPMKMHPEHENVEALLAPVVRAGLPLCRQLWLYLNPFALFKDASRGPAWARESARSYNRAQRWMLLIYFRRWSFIAAGSFLGIAPIEVAAAQSSLAVISVAGLGMGFCVAVAVLVSTGTAYLLLSVEPGGWNAPPRRANVTGRKRR